MRLIPVAYNKRQHYSQPSMNLPMLLGVSEAPNATPLLTKTNQKIDHTMLSDIIFLPPPPSYHPFKDPRCTTGIYYTLPNFDLFFRGSQKAPALFVFIYQTDFHVKPHSRHVAKLTSYSRRLSCYISRCHGLIRILPQTRGRQDIYFSITMASEKQSPPPPYLEISSSVSPGNKAANYGHDNAVAQSGEGHSSESHGDRNLTGQAGTDGHWNINEGNRNQTLQISSVVAIVIITGFLAVAYVLGSLLFLLFHLFKEKLMAH
ncbi:hypothetical protein F4815DRAFT_414323 [Daldinia loculata]|nr:hypothetical protein F4815DRAFT_414323 [Daldinia loculata]